MKKRIVPFLCGALTSAVFVSTVLAGAGYIGKISFNTNSLYLNGHEILTAGLSEDNVDSVPYINIGNADDTFREHKFAVRVVQFDA